MKKDLFKALLEHYSPQEGLSEIDPAHKQSGVDRTRNVSAHPISYYYHAGTKPEAVVADRAKHKYTVNLPSHAKIYDLGTDPDKHIHSLFEASKNRQTNPGMVTNDEIHDHLKQHKYHGFTNSLHPDLPNVVGLYHKQKVEPMGKSEPVKKPDTGGMLHSDKIRSVADAYAKTKGISLAHAQPRLKVDPAHAAKIADAYHNMKHDPNHPDVKASYNALIGETSDQFHHLINNGLKISRMKEGMANPYPTSKHMLEDVRNNNHMWYYPTEHGFGSEGGQANDHPMLQPTKFRHDNKPLLANDMFRVVHDYFGHAKEGHGFGPQGEENAWHHHKQMYTPAAHGALTAETRGQNSWVNFGPHGEANRADPKNTKYAEQKAGLLPSWAHESSKPLGKSEDSNPLHPEHIIFSAENPMHPRTVNMTHDQAIHHLKSLGENVFGVKGKYGSEENSILVNSPKNHSKIHDFATSLGQDSILHSKNGIHKMRYLNGPKKGTEVSGEGTDWYSAKPEDYYTEIETPSGKKYFAHKLNFPMEKAELQKGVKRRLFPFNPQKDIDPESEGTKDLHVWSDYGRHADSSYEDIQNAREAIAPMHPNAKQRGLINLSQLTHSRIHPETKKRQFLLHRGMSDQEHQSAVKDNSITHAKRSSWTPNPSLASDFARPNFLNSKEVEGAPKVNRGKRTSAWIDSDHIVHMPNQYGGIDEYGNPANESNQFKGEHEIIVGPHTSELAKIPKEKNSTKLHNRINYDPKSLDPTVKQALKGKVPPKIGKQIISNRLEQKLGLTPNLHGLNPKAKEVRDRRNVPHFQPKKLGKSFSEAMFETLAKGEDHGLCGMFVFENMETAQLADLAHVTHKYFGKGFEKIEEVKEALDLYFKEHPFKPFTPTFDKVEMFGPDKDVRVLRPENNKAFLLDLKDILDNIHPDKWPEYKPHVSVSSNVSEVKLKITNYILIKGGDILWKAV